MGAGMTSLMWAARHRRTGMVKVLLSAGASEDIKSSNGWRARELAKMLGYQDVVALFKPPPLVRWLPNAHSRQIGEKLCEHTPKLVFVLALFIWVISKLRRGMVTMHSATSDTVVDL